MALTLNFAPDQSTRVVPSASGTMQGVRGSTVHSFCIVYRWFCV